MSLQQLTPNATFLVRGKVGFSRITRHTTDEEREKENPILSTGLFLVCGVTALTFFTVRLSVNAFNADADAAYEAAYNSYISGVKRPETSVSVSPFSTRYTIFPSISTTTYSLP